MSVFLQFLKQIKPSRIIVFLATCASVDFHMFMLPILDKESRYYKLHGKIDQKKRTKIYSKFKEEDLESN